MYIGFDFYTESLQDPGNKLLTVEYGDDLPQLLCSRHAQTQTFLHANESQTNAKIGGTLACTP
jgi:hypothetical protein